MTSVNCLFFDLVGGVLKVVQIGHEAITLSGDGTAWFSDPENWRECEKRRAGQRDRLRNELRQWFAKGRIRDFRPTNFDDDQQPQESPERALWAAILQRAVADARGLTRPHPHEDSARIQASAVKWFRSRSIEPGSFRFCCEVLDLSPSAVLEKVSQGAQIQLRPPCDLDSSRNQQDGHKEDRN